MIINGKTVMVTGGSSGIGLQIAKSFLASGARVMICGRDERQLEQVKAEQPAFRIYTVDLSDVEAVRRLINQVGIEVDIWVNNAGIFQQYNIVHSDKHFESLIAELQINFLAAVLCINEMMPYLLTKKEAAIVNITAGMVYVPLVMYPMYNASKAALHSYITSARVQLSGTNVRVIEIAPPMVQTKLTEGMAGKKVAPTVIADAVLRALRGGRDNVLVGQVKMLVAMNKIFPRLMLRLLNADMISSG
jgi:uncharacterized oxidoreductase